MICVSKWEKRIHIYIYIPVSFGTIVIDLLDIYIIGCPARYNQITVEMSVKGFKFSAYTAFEKGGGGGLP